MFLLLKRPRNKTDDLIPLMRKNRPRRCAITGMTDKHQLPYPPPWESNKKRQKARLFPLEIDHMNSAEWDSRQGNLMWLTKQEHVQKTIDTMMMWGVKAKVKKGARNV